MQESGKAEFWIEVTEVDEQFVANVRELVVHNQVGSPSWVYDLRFTTSRHTTREGAYAAGEQELKGFLGQFRKQDYVITAESR